MPECEKLTVMKILNYGSLNIDRVYRVPHIAKPGETISSQSFLTFAGGKGANQSVAIARAGGMVYHAGKVGRDGQWLMKKIAESGVNTHFIRTAKCAAAAVCVTRPGAMDSIPSMREVRAFAHPHTYSTVAGGLGVRS